jgi:hypothetical protein
MATYTDNSNGGVDVTVDDAAKAEWLLNEGYVGKKRTTEKDEERGIYAVSAPAKNDPTLAENREKPTGVNEQKPHVANDGTEGETETVLGKDRGLDAKPVGNTDQAPKVKFTPHAKAGDFETVDDLETNSLKKEIEKAQPNPPEPKIGKLERDEVEEKNASLKDEIDKQQPPVTTPGPGSVR